MTEPNFLQVVMENAYIILQTMQDYDIDRTKSIDIMEEGCLRVYLRARHKNLSGADLKEIDTIKCKGVTRYDALEYERNFETKFEYAISQTIYAVIIFRGRIPMDEQSSGEFVFGLGDKHENSLNVGWEHYDRPFESDFSPNPKKTILEAIAAKKSTGRPGLTMTCGETLRSAWVVVLNDDETFSDLDGAWIATIGPEEFDAREALDLD